MHRVRGQRSVLSSMWGAQEDREPLFFLVGGCRAVGLAVLSLQWGLVQLIHKRGPGPFGLLGVDGHCMASVGRHIIWGNMGKCPQVQ